jgi:hypothetical protein
MTGNCVNFYIFRAYNIDYQVTLVRLLKYNYILLHDL